jgi:hypothetical protein
MGEIKKETKKSVSSNAGIALSRRILVAEDNKAIQYTISKLLEFLGFEVAVADNGFNRPPDACYGRFKIGHPH